MNEQRVRQQSAHPWNISRWTARISSCHPRGDILVLVPGTWMALLFGLLGMRDYDGHLSLNPKPLPGKMKRIRFPLTIRGQVLKADIYKKAISHYLLREGSELVTHQGEEITTSKGAPVSLRAKSKKS